MIPIESRQTEFQSKQQCAEQHSAGLHQGVRSAIEGIGNWKFGRIGSWKFTLSFGHTGPAQAFSVTDCNLSMWNRVTLHSLHLDRAVGCITG